MNYNQLVNSSDVVMVEFYASWCPHCQHMMPIVAQIKQLLVGKVEIYQLDIDQNVQTAEAEGASSVPTFIIYKNGKEQWRQSGEMDAQVLLSKIESYL